MLGRVDFEDYIWRDLHDVRIKEGLRGATLSMDTVNGLHISVDALPKAQARKLYSLAQEMEEMVMEERRVREMEEKRAAAGGVVIQGGVPTSQPTETKEDPVEKLKQLKGMLDAGLITEEEYNSKKAEILSRM